MQKERAHKHLQDKVAESIEVKKAFFTKNADLMLNTAMRMADCLKQGGKILVCGNGGSASDSQHFAGEMVGRFLRERAALPMLALTTDTAILTAIGNDYGYDEVFARQVQALGNAGDVLFAISTSGNSPNVLKAVSAAKQKKMSVIGMTGKDGGKLGELVDVHLNVALGKNPARIQETHIMIIHNLVDLVDEFYLQ